MKKKSTAVAACLLACLGWYSPAVSMNNTPAETVLSYFQACRDGDVSVMKSLITGRFYQRRKVLLEQNEEYPGFLKTQFADMQIRVVSTVIEDTSGYARVVLQQIDPGGMSTDTALVLKQDDTGIWQISDEVMPQ